MKLPFLTQQSQTQNGVLSGVNYSVVPQRCPPEQETCRCLLTNACCGTGTTCKCLAGVATCQS
jgi:hypothetical protein